MKTEKEWLEELGFYLEDQQGVCVVVDDCGGTREANLTERVMWNELIKSANNIGCVSKGE